MLSFSSNVVIFNSPLHELNRSEHRISTKTTIIKKQLVIDNVLQKKSKHQHQQDRNEALAFILTLLSDSFKMTPLPYEPNLHLGKSDETIKKFNSDKLLRFSL